MGTKFTAMQETVTGLPGDGVKCYPFRGAPDVIIKNNVIYNDNTEDEDEEDTNNTGTAEDIIEVGLRPCPQRTDYPPKIGEVLAGLHIMMVQKVLRMLLTKKEFEKF